MNGKPDISPGKAASPENIHLRQLSLTFMDIFYHQRDNSHPFIQKHLAPEFTRRNEFDGPSTKLPQKVSHSKPYQQIDVVPDIDKSGQKATVWCSKRDGGFAGGSRSLNQESVTILHWELRENVWVCVKMNTMTGVVGF